MSFDADFAAANDLLAEAFGGEVSLVRGYAERPGVTAQVFIQEYQGGGEDDMVTTLVFTDFLIDMDDYDFGDGPVEPRRGDRIKRTVGGTTHTYEVLPTPSGRVCEWGDTSGDEWRIHTKHIGPSASRQCSCP
jgi:hypothetical protein